MHFVDTNLLVYTRDDADPWKRDRAREVMTVLWETGAGRISHQVLVEFYATVTRKLKPGLPREEAIRDVRELLRWEPATPSPALFVQAWEIEERWQLSWWDSLIVAAARQAGCETLLSEDMQDGFDLDGLRIVNPFANSFDPGTLG